MPIDAQADTINQHLIKDFLSFTTLTREDMANALCDPRPSYPLSYSLENGRIIGAEEIILKNKNGVSIKVDTHGAQITSYIVDGVEFLSKDGIPGQGEGIYCAPTENRDIARGRAPITFPVAGDTYDNSLPPHGLGERSLFTYHPGFSNETRVVLSLAGTEMASVLAQHPDLYERVADIRNYSKLFVIHEIDDEGGVTTTLQFYATNKNSPGFHPYFNLFGMTAVECLKMQAAKFGFTPDEITEETLINTKKKLMSELFEEMKDRGELTKDGFVLDLNPEGKIKAAIAPLTGFTKDARMIFWTDNAGRICMEPTTSGEYAVGSPDKEVIETYDVRNIQTVAWRMKGMVD